ncbi:MAG: hypothetical protein U0521_27990 [Anaerolineae bacterium]
MVFGKTALEPSHSRIAWTGVARHDGEAGVPALDEEIHDRFRGGFVVKIEAVQRQVARSRLGRLEAHNRDVRLQKRLQIAYPLMEEYADDAVGVASLGGDQTLKLL